MEYVNVIDKLQEVLHEKITCWKRRLFLSYIFIGVIPILVLGAFFYYGNRLSWYEEIENKNYTAMGQVINKLDYIKKKWMAWHIIYQAMISGRALKQMTEYSRKSWR